MIRAPYNTPTGTSKPPKTPRKRQTLIGNEMHSPASATALQCATSIFLIGNEFHLHSASESETQLLRPDNSDRALQRQNDPNAELTPAPRIGTPFPSSNTHHGTQRTRIGGQNDHYPAPRRAWAQQN